MSETAFSKKYLPHWLFVGGALLLVTFGTLWWTKVYEDPYNVYWGMLGNSLSTTSVTKHVEQQSNGAKLNQYIALRFGADSLAYGRTTLNNATSTVKTESVGTLSNDYVRYTSIQTQQKDANSKASQTSKFLGKWAQSPVQNSDDTSKGAPFFLQSMLGLTGGNLVPMANLSAEDRGKLIKQLHQNDIFDVSYDTVKHTKQNGRVVYVYDVKIQPVAYVAFEKAFAQAVGIKLLNNVDPNNYQGQQAAEVQMTVDVHSHQLVGITYPGTQHTESFSGYDVPVQVSEPKATLTSQQLQELVGHIQ